MNHELEKLLKSKSQEREQAILQAPRPVVVEGDDLKEFMYKTPLLEVVDEYERQLKEICHIRNPSLKKDTEEFERQYQQFMKEHLNGREALWKCGKWIYFPWSKKLVHFLEEDLHFELRTTRNRELITPEEQKKYREFTVGVVGLTGGSHVALTLCLTGGSKSLKLADMDILEGSNLNRIRAGFADVGINKCFLTARQIYEIDPYADLYLFEKGLIEENLQDFLVGNPKLRAVVDEFDDLPLKIKLRREARKHGIPVVMATNRGDGVILDVERYDLDKEYPIFHGLVGNRVLDKIEKGSVSLEEKVKQVRKIVGEEDVPPRLKTSLKLIGKELVTWPQLSSTSALYGIAATFAVRKVALEEKFESGRRIISLEASA